MIVKDSFRKSASVEISGADEQNYFGHLLAYFEIVWNAMCGELQSARPRLQVTGCEVHDGTAKT
jgi:hypothetical protein